MSRKRGPAAEEKKLVSTLIQKCSYIHLTGFPSSVDMHFGLLRRMSTLFCIEALQCFCMNCWNVCWID